MAHPFMSGVDFGQISHLNIKTLIEEEEKLVSSEFIKQGY
jgi:hypothetical protein